MLSSLHARSGRTDRGLARPRIHLPYLHTVPPSEEEAFRRLLNGLARTHTFVTYSRAVDLLRHGGVDRPHVAFSFDDGFASNVVTSRIMEEYGTTAMFFVPPAFVGTRTVEEARRFYGYPEGVDEPAMTWGDLEDLLARGHEIGNHTLGHRVLSWVSEEEAREEIVRGSEMLRARLGNVEHFAWPRGRFTHMTDAAARIVFASGHTTCASAERGAHTRAADGPPEALCLRRDHVMTSWPLRHIRYFLARSAERSADAQNGWPEGWRVA